MKKFIMFLCCGLLLFAACSESEDPVHQEVTLPTPTLEDPPIISNTESTYFMLWDTFDEDRPAGEGETLLRQILDRRIQPKDVWFPYTQTRCAAMGAVTVAVVELSEPDPRILDVGFSKDPVEWWIINCGVSHVWRYSFE